MIVLLICGVAVGCTDGESDEGEELDPATAHCVYRNIFSNLEECREYRGTAWTLETGLDDCNGQQESVFAEGSCSYTETLGYCLMGGQSSEHYHIVFPGSSERECESSEMGCELFGGGQFIPSAVCEGLVDDLDTDGIGSGGSVFQPGELMCREAVNGQEPGSSANDEVCTWGTIGGCTEEGRKYIDYAECSAVLTQRPYAPVPPSNFKTPENDPLWINAGFLGEVDWAKRQAESCGCVCCHSDSVAPRGAANWDTEAEGIWTDTFTDLGLAIMAGWVDSTALGAHEPEDNNGFDRTRTGIPTTDIERMVAFFEGELGRRGASEADFADTDPTGGPLHSQMIYEPTVCENGEGVNVDGTLEWSGGRARYVYVLESGSANPSTPPNLDLPTGVLWRFDVDHRDDGITDGFTYGQLPTGVRQVFPESGEPAALEQGKEYYLYVLKDIAIPITRCLFTYEGSETVTEPGDSSGTETGTNELAPWNDVCT
ncbi:MAG: hypothetical protein HOI23_06885, partial [Deltaproteobacteria bacterium]|nr:hypothetical protein [Deltaproteobacteria bacterium]